MSRAGKGRIPGHQRAHRRPRASLWRRGRRVEGDRPRSDDDAGPSIREAQVERGGRTGVRRILICEIDQRGSRPTATTQPRPDLDAPLPQRPRQLDAFGVPLLDDDRVMAQLGWELAAGTTEQQRHARRYADSRHWTIRRAPTHRATHQAPSVSRSSRRESFTPSLELWMKVWSPTYMPTCVTPPPGRAANNRMSPGRNASITGVTSDPDFA